MTDSLSIRELYDITSKSYDSLYRDEQFRKYNIIFDKIRRKHLGQVADIGCGTGLLLDYIKENNYDFEKYVCLDISEGMIAKAREKHGDDPRTIYLVADAEQTPFLNNVFTEVFMITVWNNIEDKEKALKETIRITAEEGLIIITVLSKVEDTTPDQIISVFHVLAEEKDIIYACIKTCSKSDNS